MARGDQIYVIRPYLQLQAVYQHHGIDCGDGHVIHYRKLKDYEMVACTSVDTFAQGRKIYARNYQVCYIPNVVIQRAKSRLGERKYNLLFNNCEHFATWCKTGVSDSRQIRDFLPLTTKIKTENLSQSLKQAFKGANRNDSTKLLNKALADIKVVWDDTQPQYKHSLQEINTWEQVAMKALNNNREDLARAALARKLNYKKRAQELKLRLEHLASMTETLLLNKVESS
ncbi:MAG: NC domain-containing protein [Symploca sp. SIO2B6]|nr:NC domain-containing protein [Symploca sp. SIO2B6]